MQRVLQLFLLVFIVHPLFAQDSLKRCASVELLAQKLNRDPIKKLRFENELRQFNQLLARPGGRIQSQNSRLDGTVYTIPVVFHIVLSNPNEVSDADVQAQLDTLNKDFAGMNGDSTLIPSWFRSYFGKSIIQFCLAKRTPSGKRSNGINRVITSRNSFSISTEGVKLKSSGGVNSWDHEQYLNIWICNLSGGILGYSSFPGDNDPDREGVVIDYRTLPGGQYTTYNRGKTLTHETGHYFNLYHIWGDDSGGCSGSDFIDDTPNQANSTSNCSAGVILDNCTSTGTGIMYQNYMDYTVDKCLVMFTPDQVKRMEAALLQYYPKLISSDACQPIIPKTHDAEIISMTSPRQRLCENAFRPVVTIRNLGGDTLTSLLLTCKLSNGETKTFTWNGSLAYYQSENVVLDQISVSEGNYLLTVIASLPANETDEDHSNDSVSTSFQFYKPADNLSEGFEGPAFPSIGWDVTNADNGVTWRKVTGVAASGNASVVLANFESNAKSRDELRLPDISLSQVDSAFLSFRVAATSASAVNIRNSTPDTLEILVTTDCGVTYTSLYKKSGSALSSAAFASDAYYVPASGEWRKDSVNLSNYINKGPIIVSFRGGSSPQNNVYLDDINLRKVVINANLKERGFLVTPNPTSSAVAIQFYPTPTDLRSIKLYSVAGQLLRQVNVKESASNYYSMDLSALSVGTYIIHVVFGNRVEQRRIIRVN